MKTEDLWRAVLLSASDADDRRRVAELRASQEVQHDHDILEDQLRELAVGLGPADSQKTLSRRVEELLAGSPLDRYGVWVWYPWSGTLVRLLACEHFREVRSRRNRYKITPEEQDRLRACRIGIVGLSVGGMVAQTLALEGVGGEFRLADFDRLELTNMNRIPASVDELGLNKAVIAARALSELDPFLRIAVFSDGLGDANLEDFLLAEGKLDLVAEECDDLYMKMKVRERARSHRIPVVMETNDRGMIDIERYDLEPDRPAFHGLVGDVRAEALRGLSTKEKVPFVLKILGARTLSDRMVASLLEIDETVSSWPQLGSGVALGGALATDAARRILLGTLCESGRFYVDLEQLIRDGGSVDLSASPSVGEAPSRDEKLLALTSRVDRSAPITRAELERIVEHGILAPSGGNAQPWRFVGRGSVLECWVDTERSWTFLDFQQRASQLAIGAAVENMVLAAQSIGFEVNVHPLPRKDQRELVCELSFEPSSREAEVVPLVDSIATRVTNRRQTEPRPLDRTDQDALIAAARERGGNLQILAERDQIEAAAKVIGRCDRLVFLSKKMHAEIMGEIRFSKEDEERSRDGIGLASMELSAVDAAGLRMMARWPAVAVLSQLGLGRAIENNSSKVIRASSAFALVTAPRGPDSYFVGGRALEHVWLTATARELAIHPTASLVYLLARLDAEGEAGFEQKDARVLKELRAELERLFRWDDETPVLLFRIAYADPPTARSLRRRVGDVLSWE